MTVLTEQPHAGGFLVSEANGTRSRTQGTLASGNNLKAGAVLGVVTATQEYGEYDNAAVNGLEDAAAILFDAVDASAAAKSCVVIDKDAEVNAAELEFADGTAQVDIDAALADLAALGIIAR